MFIVEAKSSSEVDILLYGEIGFWSSITAKDIYVRLQDLQRKGYTQINLRIHSRGGSVYEGLALYGMIKSFPVKTTTVIDGIAASMMSVVMTAGDKVRMGEFSLIMLHQPRARQEGVSKKMKEAAAHLDKLTGQMAEVYAQRTGKTKEFVLENWLKAEEDVWFTAQEALEAGLIDEIVKGKKKVKAAALQGNFDGIAAEYDEFFNNHNFNNTPAMDRDTIVATLQGMGVGFEASASDADLSRLLTEESKKLVQEKKKAEASLKEVELQRLKGLMTQKQVPTQEADALLGMVESAGIAQVMQLVEARQNPLALRGQIKPVADQAAEEGKELKTFEQYQEKNPEAFLQLQEENPSKAQELAQAYLDKVLEA